MTRIATTSALIAAAALSLTACGGGGSGSVHVAVPVTTGAVTQQCAALSKALPATLMGLAKRGTTPTSANTAAWGDPAVTWRCGTGLPDALNPQSKDYNPSDNANLSGVDSGGICWAVVRSQTDQSVTFSSVDQQAIVELRIPRDYANQQSPVSLLAPAVAKASPLDPDRKFSCS
ncbi:hypothetical protein ABIA32_004590 [Streptacidiphilus sp. MAP12-20]|uniref:DUF3515 family protein n=1 Tax=Streptacidiphilus sp. MAP12-20 TaxID=3156299 RepID=UPI00351822D6